MSWHLDSSILTELSNSKERNFWAESGAYDQYNEIESQLPKDLRDRARLGALAIKEMHGTEGQNCWMLPIEGHQKILGSKSQVRLLDRKGRQIYEGIWGEVGFEIISQHIEFFIFLATRKDAVEAPNDFRTRLKGLFRLGRHKIKTIFSRN